MAYIMIHLWSKPAWMLDMEKELNKEFIEELSNVSDELHKRVKETVIQMEKLFKNGWKAHGTLYDVEFYKDLSVDEAEKELNRLGLGILIDCLDEYDEEEEELEEFDE